MSLQTHLEKYFPVNRRDEVEELILDTISIPQMTEKEQKLLAQYKNVVALYMNGCSLKSLDNFPRFDLTAVKNFNNSGNKKLLTFVFYSWNYAITN